MRNRYASERKTYEQLGLARKKEKDILEHSLRQGNQRDASFVHHYNLGPKNAKI